VFAYTCKNEQIQFIRVNQLAWRAHKRTVLKKKKIKKKKDSPIRDPRPVPIHLFFT